MPCLTTGAPAPAATIAAIVEMFTDIDRSPPVPTTSSTPAGDRRAGWRASYIASTSPSTSSMVSPLARSATAKPAICDRRRLAGEDLAHRPGGLVGAQVARRAISAREHLGPGGHGAGYRRLRPVGRAPGPASAAAGRRPRRAAIGSSGCGTARVGARPGRQPGVLRAAGQHQDRRAPVDLVLELLGDAHAAGGHGLAVEDRQVDAAGVHLLDARPARWPPRRTPARAGRGGGGGRAPGSPAGGC